MGVSFWQKDNLLNYAYYDIYIIRKFWETVLR